MRIARLGLWSLVTWVAACDKPPVEPPPMDDPPVQEPKTYRVGGSITGLSGNLLLKLNGQESLTRGADGPFTFETRLADQASYAVSVATVPAEQDCTVDKGTGKVAGADVSSVQVTCTTKTYALGGSVEGLEGTLELSLGSETLRVTAGGPFTFTTRLPRGAAWTVAVATPPAGQRCTVTNGSGTVAGDVTGISVRCLYWYTLDSFQAASGILGQGNFTSTSPDRGGSTGAGTLSHPRGNPAFVAGRLYVPDTGSHRVLGFMTNPPPMGPDAQLVLGQANFEDNERGAGQAKLGLPEGLSSDGTWLAMADRRNNRVLLHASPPDATGALPTRVVGQPGFAEEDISDACTRSGLSFPEDVFIGHGKLLVADSSNNRVLVWNTLPTTNGAPADLVLGQSSFTTCVENDANGNGTRDTTPGATTLWNPTGVWTDGTRLAVADSFNGRVLLWNTFPTTNAQPADRVLGQPDFTSGAAALTQSGMNNPQSIASTGLQLFVSDSDNRRVLVWNEWPTQNGRPADVVLGQRDFVHADPHDPPTGSASSARSMSLPTGLLLVGRYVLVSDETDNRVLVFTSH